MKSSLVFGVVSWPCRLETVFTVFLVVFFVGFKPTKPWLILTRSTVVRAEQVFLAFVPGLAEVVLSRSLIMWLQCCGGTGPCHNANLILSMYLPIIVSVLTGQLFAWEKMA